MFSNLIYTIALIILCIGGINWGLVGAFNFDLVARLFGNKTLLSRLIYVLVGISSIYVIIATIALHNIEVLTK